MVANNNSFYDAILSAGASMEKKASELDLAAALEETDLNEDELNKLASEIEDALNDIDDVDDIDDAEDEANEEGSADDEETSEEGSEDTGEGADEEEGADEGEEEGSDDTGEGADEEEGADEGEEEETSEEDEEVDETDIEQLAAAYEEEYEKYASEGYGVRDYVYNQVADEEFACTVGDMAEKLAYVAELPVFMVADDLINTIVSKISEDEEC